MKIRTKRNMTIVACGLMVGILVNIFLGNLDFASTSLLLLLGTSLNLAHVSVNNGRMAVIGLELPINGIHCPITKETKLKFLCDRIAVGPWFVGVGDVIIYCGVVSFLGLIVFKIFSML